MAAPQPVAPAAEAPPSAQVVGNAFVQQYYLVLHQSPDLVYRFYQDASRLARPASAAGAAGMDSVTTMEAISEKIMEMDVSKAEIRTVDSQESLGGGVTVLVTGHLTGRDGVRREFSQSFFLAPQEKGYFVLNDIFRFVGDIPAPTAVAAQPESDAVVPPVAAPLANGTATPAVEPAIPGDHDAVPQQEHHVVDRSPPQPEEEDEAEVYNPPPEEVVDEEQPVPEVINEVPNNVAPVVATTVAPVLQEEAPKKSYASIVKVMKEVPLPAPAPPTTPAPPKPEKQSPPAPTPVTDVLPFSSNPDNSNIQEPEVDAHAIYVRSLPLNATETQLEDEFKKFGTIKQNGIQVRSNKIQGFCYGFVEFEDSTSVQSAIEASPLTIGGRQCYVEEKRTPGSRGSSRGGRFAPGRGNNFRSEGTRGRGNYGGGRGYGRGEFSYRSDYGGRSGGRGGSARGADVGYQRVDHAGYAGGRGGRTAAAGAPAK
ncbi:unnamed protein product [Miscanthus lutarioriparius]|uniref:Uncharacterized protein n=1 Tax=Miscanthus lutarioriparius TaxID=422564 RepID=A0A811Q4I2_9POAL|nr:unnamed protein product [Miscanthus lutarioriparius]